MAGRSQPSHAGERSLAKRDRGNLRHGYHTGTRNIRRGLPRPAMADVVEHEGHPAGVGGLVVQEEDETFRGRPGFPAMPCPGIEA